MKDQINDQLAAMQLGRLNGLDEVVHEQVVVQDGVLTNAERQLDALVPDRELDIVLGGYKVKWKDGIRSNTEASFGGIIKWPDHSKLLVRQGSFASIGAKLPALQDGVKDYIDIPYGVTVIIGASGSGKTALGEWIAKTLNGKHMRVLEPEVPCYTDVNEALGALGDFLASENDHVLIKDSIRYVVFNPGERTAAGTGGMNMALFTHLTVLSVMAESLGKMLFLILNPVTVSADSMKLYIEALNGSVNGVMHIEQPGRFTWYARTAQNLRSRTVFEVQNVFLDHPDTESNLSSNEINLMNERDAVSPYLAGVLAHRNAHNELNSTSNNELKENK